MQQQQQRVGSRLMDRRQSAITVARTHHQAATAKKAVGAQEVDKLLQNQPVKRVSLQTKYARRRRRWRSGVKNGVYRLCVSRP
jgi:hypothetical protein